MKMAMGILGLVLSVSISAQDCISLVEAQSLANANIEAIRTDVRNQSSYWISRTKFREAFSNMRYSHEDQAYLAPHVVGWDCAPGASCYIGTKVTCAGEVGTYIFGD
jgi:hypothetical protein